nr:glycosyltransferase family 2 protein [uncultured Flavobacterium sp.]
MHIKPTIAIIIPVYNRAKLLPETLDSIIMQTFTDWECILVDDESTDDSFAVIKEYQNKDNRIRVYKRPGELKKGANACRNFGFKKSSASHIKWFDSDDIMLPNHLEVAYRVLVENHLDFVVTDTVNFDDENGEMLDKPYDFDRNTAVITAENYALSHVCWITDDFLGTRKIVANIIFNENIITDGDEYNFFVRILHQPIIGVLINEVLTLRRVHTNSLSSLNGEDSVNYCTKIANVKYQTAQDLVLYNNKKLIRWFLSGYIRYSFDLAKEKESIPFCKPAFKLICRYYSFSKGMAFIVALAAAKYFGKGYRVSKYARK